MILAKVMVVSIIILVSFSFKVNGKWSHNRSQVPVLFFFLKNKSLSMFVIERLSVKVCEIYLGDDDHRASD